MSPLLCVSCTSFTCQNQVNKSQFLSLLEAKSLCSPLPFLPPHLLQVLWALEGFLWHCTEPELAHRNTRMGSNLVSRHLNYNSNKWWEGFLVWLPALMLAIRRKCHGNVWLKTFFFPLWMLHTECWQIVSSKRSSPDEQVSGGCPWVFFQQSLAGQWARWTLGPTFSSSWGASSLFSSWSTWKDGWEFWRTGN